MEFIDVKKELPESSSINDECNEYYLVLVEGYDKCLAMYCDGEWYVNYYSKIVVPVTHWLKNIYISQPEN
jgi:hypothetical protein